MIDINIVNKRIEKEKERRFGVSLVETQLLFKINVFDNFIKILRNESNIIVAQNPHITLLRCKSLKEPVNLSKELFDIFEEIVESFCNLKLIYNSLLLDEDGVIRVRHNSNINLGRKVTCSGLQFTLIKEPWISLGRICCINNLEECIANIKENIIRYRVKEYVYKPCELEMVLFRDILFKDIKTIKKYYIV